MADFTLKEIKSLKYNRPEISKGYTDHSLHINVSSSDINIRPVEKEGQGKIYRG
ncbi:hypothetical protein MTBBW1_1620003 [Desulfamplus magnetovallimortis]|uniref:Uncharacterized protein n=1 Tax=Desulfamplus magnetovallimortis TaxID=1246637 RepID=A0A1W1H8V7_9BACT|nr:hypothetical protein [Desulfamplus magnetovallimortis]SLM28883.1 hypothetical protein MTBBW1_1620003 [Desulfamplus magnetovallimortis]